MSGLFCLSRDQLKSRRRSHNAPIIASTDDVMSKPHCESVGTDAGVAGGTTATALWLNVIGPVELPKEAPAGIGVATP